MKNEGGEALVQVIIAAAVGITIMMAIVGMQVNQSRENRAITEKLASIDLQRAITSVLSNPVSCAKLLAPENVVGGKSSLTINAKNISEAHPKIITLVRIAGAEVGKLASPMSSTLSITRSNGIELHVTSPTTATLTVNYDQASLVRSLPDLTFQEVPLISSGPLESTEITGCGSGASSSAYEACDPPPPPDNTRVCTPTPGVKNSSNWGAPNPNPCSCEVLYQNAKICYRCLRPVTPTGGHRESGRNSL